MEFTKEKTNIAKGVAICLMFAHHLYYFGDRLINGNTYIPLIPFLNVEFRIGTFGSICVSMFLFLSGYGMYSSYLNSKEKIAIKYSLKKLKDFYFIYWLYFIIFVPIGIFFFEDVTAWNSSKLRYSAEPLIFLKNFIGWSYTYNGEWWFIKMFLILLLILFPIYVFLAERDIFLIIFTSLFLFFLSFEISPYGSLGFIFWQTSLAVGIIFSKMKLFSSKLIEELDGYGWIRVFLALLLCFILRFKLHRDYDFLIAPFFIYFSIRALEMMKISKVFAYLGKYSFPLWLIHSFFCYYYFQDIIYFPKWSPLVFALLTVSSLLSVLVIEYLVLQLKSLVKVCTGNSEKR